ncbi:CALD1 protein, partial [Alectura lathami]|nr:CALD1 protein [Alectura lathami]
RLSYQRNDDDEEEAARERRRRARQERLRQKEEGDLSGEVTEKSEVNAQNSVAEDETKHSTRGADDEAALLERLARREERRQKRLQEALERQKEFDPTITDESLSVPSRREVNNVEENETTEKEEKVETGRGRCETEETETVTKSYQRNNWRQDGEEEEKKEEKDKEEEKPKEVPIEENQVDVAIEKSTDKEEVVESKPLAANAEEHKAENDTNAVPEGEQSITDAVDKEKEEAEKEREKLEAEEKERLKAEEEKKAAEEKQKAEEEKRAAEERERAKAEEERKAAEERERAKAEEERKAAEERERAKAEEEKRAAEEKAKLEAEKLKEKQKMEEKKIEDKQVKEKKVQEEKPQAAFLKKQEEDKEVKVEAKKEKLPEKLQPTSKKDQVKDNKDKEKAPKEEMKSIWDRKKGVPEQKAPNGERELTAPKLKSTENAFGRSNLKGTANAEETKAGSQLEEKLKGKQQEAAVELEELKKRREERRKIMEEEEQKKKQEEAERKAREEEEKKRMKEEIERRRAEAAEKRQKMPEDGVSEEKKPFKCFSPKGSSLKIEERAEFLNKSAQKRSVRNALTLVSRVSDQLQIKKGRGNKAAKPAKPPASDLPVPAEGVRNIKSMWEKGNVFSSPSGGTGAPNKETAGLKVGVSSRINEWLTKTPESNKSPAPKPSDLRPGDVSGKRNLWEKQSVEKPAASSSKVTATGKKSETNGLRQFEKEP